MTATIALVPEPTFDELRAQLGRLPVTLIPYTEEGPLPAVLGDAQVVFRWVAGKRYAELVQQGRSVRWLHTASAGVDHVLPAVREKPDLIVTDSGPAFAIAIGEFVVGWMLALAHRFPELLAQQRQRQWHALSQEELSGQTVGIVGLGPIGQGIAERCRALGMTTLGLRRRAEPCPQVDETLTGDDGLEVLLRRSDWLVLAAALTDETRTLIGETELSRMKPSARIVNIARGPIVDQAALIAALTSGRLAGAVLDVFEREPLPHDCALWTLPNVIVTPHNSPGWTVGLRRRQQKLFLENLRRFVDGEPLDGQVDLARGY
jgi:phosphoglycerate dehydrogenase-like enzyme